MQFYTLSLEGGRGYMKMDKYRTLTGIGPSHPVGGFPDRIMGGIVSRLQRERRSYMVDSQLTMACDKSLSETQEGHLTMLLLSM